MSNTASRLITENENAEINDSLVYKGTDKFIFFLLSNNKSEIFGPKISLKFFNSKTLTLKENESPIKNNFSNIGYDYGVKPFFMIVGDIEFSDLFKKADCKGMLYIFGKEDTGEMVPVQMAFLFQNEEPAEKFLDILLGWIAKSNNDGDAVSIEFIENDKGGYTLSISPEINRFHDRMIPKHLKNKVTPIFMIQTHFKEIDT